MDCTLKYFRGLVAFAALAACIVAARADEGIEFFEAKVRPIFADHCYKCHSSEPGSKIKGGLALDNKAALLKGGDSGPAIVPGDPDKSLLIKAVRYLSEELQMPPDKKKLSAEQIAALEAWVKMGAPDPRTGGPLPTANLIEEQKAKHWAFKPVVKPSVPETKNPGWVREGLDAFILAKLESKGLKPSPPADRRTLIRRVTFDLTGLPPTPEEVQAFVADKSADAYSKVVERLLASHAYGERWARHWLDVARYADTKGYVFEEERRYPYSYTYRDYVIRAFNEDLPYNRFVVEQLAADLLPLGEDKRPLAALGFLTLGRRFLNVQADIIDDRIDVMTRGMLGLTVTCARCHDHKYDPISAKDYYSLYGVFASSSEPQDKPLLGEGSKPPEYPAFVKEREKRVKEYEDYKTEKHQEVLAGLRKRVGDYLLLAHDTAKLEDKSKADNLARERKLESSVVRRWSKKLEESKGKSDPVLEPWLRAVTLTNSTFKDDFTAAVRELKESNKVNPLIAEALLAEPAPGELKQVAERYNKAFTALQDSWEAAQKKAREEKAEAPKQLAEAAQDQLRQLVIGENSLYNYNFEEVNDMLDVPAAQKTRALKRKIDELEATHPGSPPRAMALVENPTPHNPRVFIRGNPNNPGPEVPRQFLELIDGPNRKPFTKGGGRLEMAEKIADRNNPLTARVLVNRVWLHHFGAGLVRTPSDFGLRSDPPTHPELLDYLAATFMDEGWSLKKLHRHIVMSSTYQQAADDNPKHAEIDPANDLLWRMNRRRLEFEAMRDTLLVTAGKLDLRAGGQGVEISTAKPAPRRSIYGFIERQNLPGMFRTFDFASPDATSPQRFSTTVPQQALYMMNSPFIADQARELAARPEVSSSPTLEAKVKSLYQIAYQRPPSKDELRLAKEFLSDNAQDDGGMRHPVWQYGYGEYDTNTTKVVSFTKLPHYNGESWQGGRELPDPKLGWVTVNARGGHPGGKKELASIRRWTAPEATKVALRGELVHESKDGDGVRARVVSSRQGLLGEWTAKDGKKGARIESIEVEQGEVIDFVVDCIENENSDSFRWEPVLERKDETGTVVAKWTARGEFSGNQDSWQTLNKLERYAQALLVSNEMMFVD
ncbi:MAG TPA: PSD1 and planctomycete cytochrome C domain-containing protein [Methylomirabilota bacterium]|nr:PSD1 and planctomycete cytochrome C domain-containing protein [Methylomirabilota bacterium]